MATDNHTEKPIPFFPDHVRTEAKVAGAILLIILALGVLGLIFPVGLGPPADPLVTPEHIKPEWYFLALYQLLKYIPKTAGVILPILGVLFLFALPFIDRRPEDTKKGVRRRALLAGIMVLLLVALTIWGEVS